MKKLTKSQIKLIQIIVCVCLIVVVLFLGIYDIALTERLFAIIERLLYLLTFST